MILADFEDSTMARSGLAANGSSFGIDVGNPGGLESSVSS
jgi:hypothetical protein